MLDGRLKVGGSWLVKTIAGSAPLDCVERWGSRTGPSGSGRSLPGLAGQPITAHWGMPDPAAVDGSEVARSQAFHETFRALEKSDKDIHLATDCFAGSHVARAAGRSHRSCGLTRLTAKHHERYDLPQPGLRTSLVVLLPVATFAWDHRGRDHHAASPLGEGAMNTVAAGAGFVATSMVRRPLAAGVDEFLQRRGGVGNVQYDVALPLGHSTMPST